MKKIISSILLLFFMVGQINLTMASHFCENSLVDTTIAFSPEKNHCCGDNEKEKDCCEDKYTVVETDKAFGKAEIDFTVYPDLVLVYSLVWMRSSSVQSAEKDEIPSINNSPSPDLLALYQNYLI